MTRPEFERTMNEIRARIAELPESERAALEALAAETVQRHEDISRNSIQSTRALERLELAFERMDNACRRLATLAEEARETFLRANAPGPQAPGLH